MDNFQEHPGYGEIEIESLEATKSMAAKSIAEHPDVQRLIKQVVGLQIENKKLRQAFGIFVKNVAKETHSMSFEKMHPTLKMLFNHLLSHLKFAEQALKEQ